MQNNWQVRAAADELAVTAQLVDIVQCYAPSGYSISEAKRNIIQLQKKIAEEKKYIRKNIRRYKPQIQIYEEMRKLEARAYLYDVADVKEYKSDYLEYKKLSVRLHEKYGKTIDEVASFYVDQKDQLVYAEAQKEELSLQYKALVNYEKYQGRTAEAGLYLFDAVGHSKAKREAEYGVYSSRLVYITADENKDAVLRVMTTPDIVDGKNTVSTTITVMTKDGESLEVISSNELTGREFNKVVNELKYKYEFMNCHVVEVASENAKKEQKENAETENQNMTRRKSR